MEAKYLQLTIVLAAVFGLGTVHCCSQQAIVDCLTTFVTPIQQGFNPFENQNTFTQFCHDNFATFKRCLSGKTSGCGEVVRNMFEGVFNSYNYMCGHGKEGAVEYGECLDGQTVKSSLQICQNTMVRRLQENKNADMDTKCEYMDQFLDCGVKSGQQHCGADAGEYYDKVIRMATAPLLEQISCGCSAITAMLGLLGTALSFLLLIR